MSTCLNELIEKAPNIEAITLFYCTNDVCTKSLRQCTTITVNNNEYDEEYDWSLHLQCRVCHSNWWLCRHCALRKQIKQLPILRRHQYSNHRPNLIRNITKKDNIIIRRRKRTDEEANVDTEMTVSPTLITNSLQPINDEEVQVDNDIELATNDTMEQNDDDIDFENNDDYNVTKQFLEEIRSKRIDKLTTAAAVHPSNSTTKEYYSFDISSSGNKFLVANMWSSENGNFEEVFRCLTTEEVSCQILISEFARSLSRNQQRDFGKVVDYILEFYVRQKEKAVCSLPRTIADIRRMYTDGTDSVSKRLPIPNVVKVHNHSYVSLLDCVADFLFSNKIKLKCLEDCRNDSSDFENLHHMSLFGNERIREIIQDSIDRVEIQDSLYRNEKQITIADPSNVLLLFLKVWSDDFDPNSSIKSNRQSVWVKTVTLFGMSRCGKTVSRTYPVATAPKGTDHEEVESRFLKEMLLLRSGKILPFFYRITNQVIYVHSDIYCVSADQPERRTNLMLSAGNSIHHKRFGYVVDYNQCLDIIKSCDKCTNEVLTETQEYIITQRIRTQQNSSWRMVPCTECTSWMYFDDSPLLSYRPDKNYPKCKLNETGMIRMSRVTKSMLEEMIREVELAIIDKRWTPITCKAYLKTAGLHTKAINKIMDTATNRSIYLEAERNKESEIQNWAILRKDYEKDKSKYGSWKLPSSWYNFDNVELYVDVPMHLLMLGVGKSVFIKISRWLKIRMQGVEFKESTKGFLDQLKVYSLDWCKILLYPNSSSDKFGGWVAENFLAMIRITNWFYSLLSLMRKPAQDYPDLNTPYSTWIMKQNVFWLEIRGLPTDGNAKLLKERVKMYHEMDELPPLIENTAITVDDVMTMLDAMTDMIGMMMSSNTRLGDIDYIELIIRKFLILYGKVDKAMTKKESPSWMSQYNFLCLLNVPNIMRRFGCMRNLWEGGIEGEGFLRSFKKELKNGLKPKWQIWSVTNLLRRNVHETDTTGDYKWKVELAKKCRIYNCYKTLTETIMSGGPISAISIEESEKQKLYMVYRNINSKTKVKGIQLNIKWSHYEEYCFMKYYAVTMSAGYIDININIVQQATGCLALPKIISTKGFLPKTKETKYCLIYSDWRRS